MKKSVTETSAEALYEYQQLIENLRKANEHAARLGILLSLSAEQPATDAAIKKAKADHEYRLMFEQVRKERMKVLTRKKPDKK